MDWDSALFFVCTPSPFFWQIFFLLVRTIGNDKSICLGDIQMKTSIPVTAMLALLSSTTTLAAQDKYSAFVGQYVASYQIASKCDGISVYDQQSAGTIAKQSDGLRKQKVLRLLYYSKTTQLTQLARYELQRRNIDPKNTRQLCQFGRQIVGKNDQIGRFLK